MHERMAAANISGSVRRLSLGLFFNVIEIFFSNLAILLFVGFLKSGRNERAVFIKELVNSE